MTEQYALEELIDNYQNKDLIKAKVIIDHLVILGKTEQQKILFALNKWEDDFALPVLVYLFHKRPDVVRSNDKLHSAITEKAAANPSILLKNLVKIEPETYKYVELVGVTKLRAAIPRLRQFLTGTSDQKLVIESIRCLGKLKDRQSVEPIGEYLLSTELDLQNTVVQALCIIGDDKAIALLSKAIELKGEKASVVLNLASEIKNSAALEVLNYALNSSDTLIRNKAKAALIKSGIDSIPFVSKNLSRKDADLLVHSLNILQEISDEASVKAVRQFLNTSPEDSNVRFAAFEALSALPSLKGDYVLATGLTDQDESIRIAAARALENNLTDSLLGGIKNMIASKNAESIRIIKAVVDALTSDLFVKLLEEDYFKEISTEYLAEKVHRDTRNHYLDVLGKHNLNDLVAKIGKKAASPDESNDKTVICAVDDSNMILRVYRRILNDLGFEPVLFQFPEECLSWLETHKPKVLFTDLNMPEITGIELAESIRKKYDQQSLPIVMVTTQQSGTENIDKEKLGINTIISKPFDAEILSKTIESL